MNLRERKEKFVSEFKNLKDWEEKYQKLIDLGKASDLFPEEHRTEENKVSGCVSQVWLFAELVDDEKIKFYTDSDAFIVKGLVTLLQEVYSGSSPKEILSDDGSFLSKIGLEENLTPNRVNGMYAVWKQMKIYALAFQKIIEAK